MTIGGNNLNYFPENQLSPNFLIFAPPPEYFCDAFCVAGVPLDAPVPVRSVRPRPHLLCDVILSSRYFASSEVNPERISIELQLVTIISTVHRNCKQTNYRVISVSRPNIVAAPTNRTT